MSDTAVCFTSDHGEMLGDHNLWRKTYAYEASARVPMILRLPHGHGGERNLELDAVVGWEDIMPTFLDLAGLETPRAVEGRSTLPLVVGESAEWREYYHHEHAPCYHPQNCYQALTSSRWKYIWNPVPEPSSCSTWSRIRRKRPSFPERTRTLKPWPNSDRGWRDTWKAGRRTGRTDRH